MYLVIRKLNDINQVNFEIIYRDSNFLIYFCFYNKKQITQLTIKFMFNKIKLYRLGKSAYYNDIFNFLKKLALMSHFSPL